MLWPWSLGYLRTPSRPSSFSAQHCTGGLSPIRNSSQSIVQYSKSTSLMGHWTLDSSLYILIVRVQYSVSTTLALRWSSLSSLAAIVVLHSGSRGCPALSIPVNVQRQRQRRQVTGYWIGFLTRNSSSSEFGFSTRSQHPALGLGWSSSSLGWPINGPQAQGFFLPIVGPSSSWIRYLCSYPTSTSTSTSSSAFSPHLEPFSYQFGDGQGAIAVKLSRSHSCSQLWPSRS